MTDQARLAECVGRLDAGTRALLDLSLRRAIPDEQVASVLGVDAASIPPRRARGIAELADMMEVPGPSELAALLIAIPELPESAWDVPVAAPQFSGQVSRARRARAFRRTAVAASPLVALGAVIAAIAVSAGSDNGGGRSVLTGAGSGAAGHAASGPQASVFAPAPRHGLPAGVPLTPARSGKAKHSRAERAAARRHRARRHQAAGAQQALARREGSAAPRIERVVFHPPAPAPAPVIHHAPRHVKHHNAPALPKPAPAPHLSPPSTPAPAPAPAPVPQPNSTVQVSAPSTQVVSDAPSSSPKPYKPSVPQPSSLRPPGSGGDEGHGSGGDEGHGCGDRHSEDHGPSFAPSHGGGGGDGFPGRGHHYGTAGVPGHAASGTPFTPPGLFKKRSGLRH